MMCGGVSYKVQGRTQTVYYSNPQALLPVLHKNGSIGYYPWGRIELQDGHLPISGWANHDSIKAGEWNQYKPKPVKIAIDEFMVMNRQKKPIWYDVEPGTFIQGLLATWISEVRVYVVTIKPEFKLQKLHDRFPRIIEDIKSQIYAK